MGDERGPVDVEAAEAVLRELAEAPEIPLGSLQEVKGGGVVGERYRLDAVLSQGGFGEVWRGWDEACGAPVAVKLLLRKHLGVASAMEAFRREGRALAELSHPGVVRLEDRGVDSGRGVPFQVMELLEGGRAVMGGRSLDEVLGFFEVLCGVLAHLHARGIVHLDLKPDNVFWMAEARRDGVLRVLDLGIARRSQPLRRRWGGEEASGEVDGIVGSWPYMSPEQFAPERRATGPASDLYAVGVMLYEALSGRRPFEGGFWTMVVAHTQMVPPPLALGAGFEELERLVMALLSKPYGARPGYAGEVCRRLGELRASMRAVVWWAPGLGGEGGAPVEEATEAEASAAEAAADAVSAGAEASGGGPAGVTGAAGAAVVASADARWSGGGPAGVTPAGGAGVASAGGAGVASAGGAGVVSSDAGWSGADVLAETQASEPVGEAGGLEVLAQRFEAEESSARLGEAFEVRLEPLAWRDVPWDVARARWHRAASGSRRAGGGWAGGEARGGGAREASEGVGEAGDVGLDRRPWRVRRLNELPLIGREGEQEALWGVAQAVARGPGAAGVILRGARGVGKRRLARWLVERIHEEAMMRALIVRLASREDLGAALREGLFRALRHPKDERLKEVRERAAEVMPLLGGEALEAVSRWLLGEGELDEGIWSSAIAGLIGGSGGRPVVVWVDGEPAGRIGEVAGWIGEVLGWARRSGQALLVVWSVADGLAPGAEAAIGALKGASGARVVEVGPLGEAAGEALARRLAPDLEDRSRRLLARRSEGNAFFMFQILEAWHEDAGALEVSEGGLCRVSSSARMPVGLGDLAGYRLEVFLESSGDREGASGALETLALLGSSFTAYQADACLVSAGEGAASLVSRGLLGSSEQGPVMRLSLVDLSLREVLLGRLNADAGRLEAAALRCVDVRLLGSLEAMGVSWEQAREEARLAEVTVSAMPSLGDKARAWWRLLALDAQARVAWRRRQREALEALVERLGRDAHRGGDAAIAYGLWSACAGLIGAEGEAARAAREALGAVASVAGSPLFEALARLQIAEEALDRRALGAPGLRADLEAALAGFERALEVFAVGTYAHDLARHLWGDAARGLGDLCELPEAQAWLDRAMACFEALGDLQGQHRSLLLSARKARRSLSPEAVAPEALAPEAVAPEAVAPEALAPEAVARVEGLLSRLEVLSERLEDPRGVALAQWERAELAAQCRQWDRARSLYVACEGSMRAVGDTRGASLALNALGDLERRLGRFDAAHMAYARFYVQAHRAHWREAEGLALCNLGWVELGRGRRDRSRGHFEASAAMGGEGGGRSGDVALARLGLAVLAAQAGDWVGALGLLAQVDGAHFEADDDLPGLGRRMIQSSLVGAPVVIGQAIGALMAAW